jgi:hypothetical protein
MTLDKFSGAPFYDVRDGACEHLQAFWHLKGHRSSIVFANMVNSLVDFEGVIWRQRFDGGI